MKTRGSAVVGYNVQTAVVTTNHLIMAHEVVNHPIDNALLSPMAHKAQEAMGVAELAVLSDRGYYTGPQIVACEDDGIVTYVPKPLTSGSKKRGLYPKQAFVYDRENDQYHCPAGEVMPRRYSSLERGLTLDIYVPDTAVCLSCSQRAQCTTSSEPRRIRRWENEDVLDEMQARLESAPEKMQQRRETVEHPFGTLKGWMGYTHFLTKTLAKVRTEMSLQVLAYNMKRVMNLIGVEALLKALQPA